MKLKTRRRMYVREAFVTLVAAQLAVRFISPARIFSWANRPPKFIARFSDHEVNWIAWAVEKIAGKGIIKPTCLPQALATHAMLRRRGIASRVCLAAARENGELAAHAWVEVGADKILGEDVAGRFTPIARFGS
jgi:hypothetical protein